MTRDNLKIFLNKTNRNSKLKNYKALFESVQVGLFPTISSPYVCQSAEARDVDGDEITEIHCARADCLKA